MDPPPPPQRTKLVYGLCLFRPKVRNEKLAHYMDSLRKAVDVFRSVYPDPWLLYIYHDASLFAQRELYTFSYTVPREATQVDEADVFNEFILDCREHHSYVVFQYVKMDGYMELDEMHHVGLVGTMLRFHGLRDPEIAVFVSRDADANVVISDYHNIVHWMTLENSAMQYYGAHNESEFPYHLDRAHIHTHKTSGLATIKAGMVAFKPELKPQLWSAFMSGLDFFRNQGIFTNDKREEKLWDSYGIDERILNYQVAAQFSFGTVEVEFTPFWMFYVTQEGAEPDDGNLYTYILPQREAFEEFHKRPGLLDHLHGEREIDDLYHDGYYGKLAYEFMQSLPHDERINSFDYVASTRAMLLFEHMLGDMTPVDVAVRAYTTNEVIPNKFLWDNVQYQMDIMVNTVHAPFPATEEDMNKGWYEKNKGVYTQLDFWKKFIQPMANVEHTQRGYRITKNIAKGDRFVDAGLPSDFRDWIPIGFFFYMEDVIGQALKDYLVKQRAHFPNDRPQNQPVSGNREWKRFQSLFLNQTKRAKDCIVCANIGALRELDNAERVFCGKECQKEYYKTI